MNRPALLLLIAAVGALALLVGLSQTGAGQMLLGRWSFTKSIVTDRGTYFRLKVNVAYKGEQQDFDIVVGCNVRWTTYKDNGRTYEAGLIPTLFGKRMSDGAGLVVRPPNACPGQTTADGRVPPDFIPILVVYDDANTMGFGTAYVTEDAYHNPLSVLTYGGATIEKATRAEFDEFRASQQNIVTPAMYFSDSPPELEMRNLQAPPVMFGQNCYGYARFRLVGEQRVAAQRYWPADHPEYWRPKTQTEVNEIYGASPMTQMMETDAENAAPHLKLYLTLGLEPDAPSYGAPTHSGNGLIPRKTVFPASVYPNAGAWVRVPTSSDLFSTAWSVANNGPRVGASVDFREGRTKGFAYCWWDPIWYVKRNPDSGDRNDAVVSAYYSKWAVDLVDGIPVVAPTHKDEAFFFVQRDEFVFRRFLISLDSTRGDV